MSFLPKSRTARLLWVICAALLFIVVFAPLAALLMALYSSTHSLANTADTVTLPAGMVKLYTPLSSACTGMVVSVPPSGV